MEFDIAYKITSIDSTNRVYAGMHYGKRSAYTKKIKMLVTSTLRKYECELYTTPVFITFSFNDGLDIDNHSIFVKCVIDAMKGILIVDDRKKHVVGVTMMFDNSLKKTVRVKIEEV